MNGTTHAVLDPHSLGGENSADQSGRALLGAEKIGFVSAEDAQ